MQERKPICIAGHWTCIIPPLVHDSVVQELNFVDLLIGTASEREFFPHHNTKEKKKPKTNLMAFPAYLKLLLQWSATWML